MGQGARSVEQGKWRPEKGNKHGAWSIEHGAECNRRPETGKRWRKRENIFNYLIFNIL
jgi:hypothetical protein